MDFSPLHEMISSKNVKKLMDGALKLLVKK